MAMRTFLGCNYLGLLCRKFEFNCSFHNDLLIMSQPKIRFISTHIVSEI